MRSTVARQTDLCGTNRDRGLKRTFGGMGGDEDEQPALKRRILMWPPMGHGRSPSSGHPADNSISYSSSTVNPVISDGGSLIDPTAVPTSGEEIIAPENIGGNFGEDENHHPCSLGMRLRAPPNPPSFPKPRRQIDPHSFTLTPIPQGDVLRALAPPEEPRSLKDKLTTAATIIGRPFTKTELGWVMATLWPDTVSYLGKGQKKKGQAVRPPDL